MLILPKFLIESIVEVALVGTEEIIGIVEGKPKSIVVGKADCIVLGKAEGIVEGNIKDKFGSVIQEIVGSMVAAKIIAISNIIIFI